MRNIISILTILCLSATLSGCFTAAVAGAGAAGGYVLGKDKDHHDAKERERARKGEIDEEELVD